MTVLQRASKTLKHTFKSVLKSFVHYLCFYIAIFVVGTLTSSLLFALGARRADFKASVADAYAFVDENGIKSEDLRHIRVENLSNASYTAFYNNALRYDESLPIKHLEYEKYTDGFGNKKYNVWISLKEPLKSSANETLSKLFYPLKDEDARVIYTDAFNEKTILKNMTAKAVFSVIVASLISFVGLMLLYILRLNHFKYLYGVYMSFGADFKKLFSTAAGEMSAVTLITFVPSVLSGYLVAFTVMSAKKVTVPFGFGTIVFSFGLILIITVLAVFYPMKLLSRSTPINLLMTRDNSNLVTSPKTSFRLFGTSFPGKYELFSMVRFGKYYAKLLLSTTAFCTVFVLGFCLAAVSIKDNLSKVSAFEITNGAEISSEEKFDTAMLRAKDLGKALDGIDKLDFYTVESTASGLMSKSHILVKNKNIYNAQDHIVDSREQREYSFAACEYVFYAHDEFTVEKLSENKTCKVKGDPSLVLDTSQKYVIVSEKIYGKKVFDFEVGDKITLAKYVSGKLPVDEGRLSPLDILSEQIYNFDFEFEEFTVCAVVDSEGEDGCFTVGLNADRVFECAKVPPALKINVFLANDISLSDKENARASVLGAIGGNGNWTLVENEDFSDSIMRHRSARAEFCRICGVLLLIFSPLIWAFSQIMFYKKREKEVYVLRALGAFEKDILELHVRGGFVLAIASLVLTTVVSFAACYGMDLLSSAFTTVGIGKLSGLNTGVYHSFSFPYIAIAVCAVVSVASGICSALVPYLATKRKKAAYEVNLKV